MVNQTLFEFAEYCRKKQGSMAWLWNEYRFLQINGESLMDELCVIVCRKLHVIQSSFFSKKNYGNIPKARQMFVCILRTLNCQNKDIAKHMGWAESRTAGLNTTAIRKYKTDPEFQELTDKIIEQIKQKLDSYE